MRRTLALLGAAALAVAGLAGPANASDINAQTDVVFADVHPDVSTPTNSRFDMATTSGIDESLAGLTVAGCVGASSTPIVFVNEYGAIHEVPAAGIFRTVPPNYTGPGQVDFVWDASSNALNSLDYDLRLVSDFEGPNEAVIDSDSKNPGGTLNGTCLANLPS